MYPRPPRPPDGAHDACTGPVHQLPRTIVVPPASLPPQPNPERLRQIGRGCRKPQRVLASTDTIIHILDTSL